MDVLVLADLQELLSWANVVWKTCWERCVIGTDREKESGKSVLSASSIFMG